MSKVKMKEVFRYARPYSSLAVEIDGFKNHFHVTSCPGQSLILLEKGITSVAQISTISGKRKPVIIIRSSPKKIGSETTPWQDIFDVDNGHIRYYGDNKNPEIDPAHSPGNRLLLEAHRIHNDSKNRKNSVPLIFYKTITVNNKSKGFIEFNGFGVITGVELITQYDRKLDRTFSNYAFNFHVFSLARENEQLNWEWIRDRRNKRLSLEETLVHAPYAWKDWVKNGNKVLEKHRRRVSKLLVVSRSEQLPSEGSKEEKVVLSIYKYYVGKKSRFEALAAAITARIFKNNIGKYYEGWITPATTDGGADFYGRFDIGKGFGKAKLIVLGQAKCENPKIATNGNDIARTVARLRRGWVGVYVTTSFFSEPVQREVIEDEYPIMLVNGYKMAQTVLQIIHDEGYSSIKDFLDDIDLNYDQMVQNRRPDELLIE
jgi:hypothetical protein